ncbi:hypothetical protein [Rhodanobacter sp. C05]|uniref:hypothetical protein n=1 Tax=Rhodanobacter sp. C05 TaxID=1945855 RepID=UPI000984E55F|nr:hypothetical protein [Rhodanobacter sp. C05]OOG40708.1 hypothetical protein B0E51_08705 [Rhodanobacter sp. C05]
MIALYLTLLTAGIGLFVLSYVAQFRLATMLRQRHPQQWKIIAEPEHGQATAFRIWIRMQHALRSPALPALGDTAIDRWQRIWRYSPWLGWLCWLAALAMRLLLR